MGWRLHGQSSLYPLFYGTGTDDILLVQINPVERKGTPTTSEDIRNRLNEITFNATLLREMRAIDFVTRPDREGHALDQGLQEGADAPHRPQRGAHRHRRLLEARAKWDFFLMLKKAGRAAAKKWLAAHYDDLGKRATIDLRTEFG